MRPLALALLVVLLPLVALAEDRPWFTNVARESGLADVPAKDAILVDLNGDGFYDLCLDRSRFYLSDGGRAFKVYDAHGLAFPKARVVPLTDQGQPDEAKGAEQEILPHVLYFADVDNDGDADAVWGVHSSWEHFDGKAWVSVPACDPGVRSSVWLNDGKGKFARAPESAYTAKDAFGPVSAVALVDTDLDGRLDLYEGREYRRYGVLYGCGVDRLWKGDGKGGFTDVTRAAGMWLEAEPGQPNSARPSYGVTHADWNNDGRPDLMEMAYGRQWNLQWRNQGDGTFAEVGRETGFAGDDITHGRYPPGVGRPPEQPFRSNGNTFDCAVGDVDNDGDLDCFLGEIRHAWAGESSDFPALLLNQGEAGGWKFKRIPVTELLPPREFRDPANFNYGDLHVAFADVDNDGRLDLFIGSGDYPDGQFLRLYRQKDDGAFEEATKVAGFDWEGCGDLSIGDLDRDGDVDVVAGRSFMRLSQEHRDKFMGGLKVNAVGVFRNDVANRSGNHWLVVTLRGKGEGAANRAGIGARIAVTAGGVTRIREIRAGSGLGNHQDPPEAHFGLGKAAKIDRVTVRWPNAGRTEQVFENVPLDRHVTLVEGETAPVVGK